MSLETYTGKVADMVASNPTPTDPKSQGDDHLRGIKFTMQQDCITYENMSAVNGNAVSKVIRFADGTQIAYSSETRTDIAVSAPYGSLFTGSCAINFALPFLGTPSVSCGAFCADLQAGWGNVAPGVTESGCTLLGFDIAARPIGTVFYVSMIAVGRWK